MIRIDVEQGSPEWVSVRLGIPSASNFDKLIDIDGKPSRQRTKYLYQLAGERVSGIKEETYQNAAMVRGIEMESEAAIAYTISTGNDVESVGFCMDDDRKYGASPDRLVGTDGLLEIKCPLVATHVGYLINGGLPSEYFQQVQGQLFVTGREWLDFVSYSPGLKIHLVRVLPDKKFIKALKAELSSFCKELDEVVSKIK